MKQIKLGAGSGYWGDMLEPAVELAKHGNLDYLGFDFLAELTMSLLQRAKLRDSTKGYIPDVGPWMRALLPITHANGTKMILNGGGTNCVAAAELVLAEAKKAELAGVRVAAITGDDLTDRIGELRSAGVELAHMEDPSRSIDEISDRIVSAHAYIGSESIIEALELGAEVVIGGRLADSSVYVGPIMHEFGWDFSNADWDLIGAAITVAHVIECAGICCGGMSSQWKNVPEPWNMGFPIAEFSADGTAEIFKLPGTGGLINEWTIKEHLLYETHDPSDYRMPDGIADLRTVRVGEVGENRVSLTDMSGRERPEMLKVQIGYTDGWIAEARVIIPFPDTMAKADRCEEIIRKRLEIIGLTPRDLRFDRVGIDALAGPLARRPKSDPEEIELRVSAHVDTREEAAQMNREVTHVTTIGPVGTAFGAPVRPREVIALWPTLVPRALVPTSVVIEEAGSNVVIA